MKGSHRIQQFFLPRRRPEAQSTEKAPNSFEDILEWENGTSVAYRTSHPQAVGLVARFPPTHRTSTVWQAPSHNLAILPTESALIHSKNTFRLPEFRVQARGHSFSMTIPSTLLVLLANVVRRGRDCGPDSSVIETTPATRKRAAGTSSSSTITAFRDLTAPNSPRDWLFSTCKADYHPSCPLPGRFSGWLSLALALL